ncbi:PHP domain-containing protein [Nocardioides mangrovicus]|uniref:PHP domain-containing protein n=1 Tax=Nocardioides mangrovicus TaxID=2478913 RepID=A0A3L8P5B0_9ACTN|nr:PHP domain-containing protein [Nocardioides mangrovicus]RLV50405.1 PHP domain-containing protein [Nocardioides mangrovicus]
MGHDHAHPHDHPHDHSHSHDHSHGTEPGPDGGDPVLDLSIPDAELAPHQLARRGFLTRAGILGAGLAGASVLPAGAAHADGRHEHGHQPSRRAPRHGYAWLAGDHHIHTQQSSDAQYRVADHVKHASAYGLDWMVITDHGSIAHAKIGVEKVNPDIRAAREEYGEQTLVFQGLEWNIPAAEHGTVFVHPGSNEVAVLKEFENSFDGVVNNTTASSTANESAALRGLDFLAASVTKGRVKDAMFFANHPARKGIDSPHEIRGWRDQQPRIALGMEGAPGHQAAGIPAPYGPGSGRGYYDNSPSANSFAGYPLASYVTYGGFDWMTATVGGLWDSLLAEGKPWWITANSDSHQVYADDSARPVGQDTQAYFDANGRYGDPVHGSTGPNLTQGDFWPGYYSRTHVGAEQFGYAAVMQGLRAGRVWVDHGSLLGSLDVRVRPAGSRDPGYPLGSAVRCRRGQQLELVVSIVTQDQPNWAEFVPALAKVDVIRGTVTGAVSDKDTFTTPTTKVVKTFDVTGRRGQITLTYPLGRADQPFYLRVRGSDGKRTAAGINGAGVDAAGPQADALGNADPWNDLWFYTNPIWVLTS